MALNYFNRYKKLDSDGKHVSPPFIKLTEKQTDKFTTYVVNKSRLDKFSQQFYGAPYYGWLILMANPTAGSIEFNIPDNFFLRVPYPLISSLQDYKRGVELYNLYYGEK
jgi:hypothetical protein